MDTKEPKKYAVTGSGPEYEALGILGSCNLVEDIHAVAKAMYQPAKEGCRAGKVPGPLDPTLDGYYKLRGWDSDGKPTAETLKELGLTEG
jgi:aldehyde:ferredoxin oxidoreductase